MKVKDLIEKLEELVNEDSSVLELDVWLNSGEYSLGGISIDPMREFDEEPYYLNIW